MVSVERVEEYCKIPSEVNLASFERISKGYYFYCVVVRLDCVVILQSSKIVLGIL